MYLAGCVAGEALLELKTAFNATGGSRLGSWRPADGDPCGWEGISCSFPDLRIQSINLPYMQLGGIISPSIGKLTKLHRLALHQNSLHGPIPAEIKNCTELRAIYLRANYLQGGILPKVRRKSRALRAAHPETFPWNPRVSCRAAAFRPPLLIRRFSDEQQQQNLALPERHHDRLNVNHGRRAHRGDGFPLGMLAVQEEEEPRRGLRENGQAYM